MNKNCIAVPVSALATYDYNTAPTSIKGEGEPKMIQPREGDPVDFQVRGSVASVEGETAFVRLAFVNGKRVEDAASEDEAEASDGEAEMLKAAEKADEGEEY